jgi:hypothetical protein
MMIVCFDEGGAKKGRAGGLLKESAIKEADLLGWLR